ncbi:tropomyosin-2-like [Coffea eugenioides]|uniref:tropomyosin-2-like n=1 Tax=Coffea eugenioides TaxID=49369 RepID=UPI000F60ECEA|nr:tropomyosin-2-like [Coffea eugenioides]
MHSNLPRDVEFSKKLTPAEVVQSVMLATASTTAFVTDMAQRYSDLVEAQESGKLQNKISKLEKKLAVSESEKTELQKRLQQGEAKEEETETTINSLKSALEEEQKRGNEVKKSHEQALEGAGASVVEVFRRSKAFTKDLGDLTMPSFMFGYTSAIDEAVPHLSSEALKSLRNKANYNEDSKERCDWMAEGIQVGRNLAEVRDEFNKWLSKLDEVFEEEEGGEEATFSGEDAGEKTSEEHKGGGEPHPGGEETGKETDQEGAETGV